MAHINPPPHELGRINAIVGGRSRRYEVRNFAAPLSVKAVISGVATWSTAAGRFEVGPAGCLIVNDGEEYSIEVDSLHPVETFCVFFSRGFVEEAHQSAITGSADLLDLDVAAPPFEFAERLQSDEALRTAISGAHAHVQDGLDVEESISTMAQRLVALRTDVAQRVARLPVLKASTRDEIKRRLDRSVAFIHGDLPGDLSLDRIANAACLAPFHFHRLFASYFGETPHRYVTRLRLDRAIGLLAGTDRNILDIASDCGFQSLGSFTTLFTRRFGVPPARFRKKREAAE